MRKLGKKLPRLGAALALFAALGLAVAVSGCSNSGGSVPMFLPPGLSVTPFPPEALPDGTDGTAGTSGSYVTFGKWPQTLKASAVTVDETETEVHGAFTYCKGSDGAWYVKQAESANSADYTYSDGSPVAQSSANSEKWFKVEPIKWRVLTTDYNGKKLLLAESVLINSSYYDYEVDRSVGSATISANNYEHSKIRAYLNGLSFQEKESSSSSQRANSSFVGKGFFQTAFTAAEQAAVATTSVDNSARSTNPDSNANRWGNGNNLNASDTPTRDKVFLLSEQEVTKAAYGFSEDEDAENTARIRKPTDFALASGANTNSGLIPTDGGNWWLRSPHYDSIVFTSWPYYIGVSGEAGTPTSDNCGWTFLGVVPALCVSN